MRRRHEVLHPLSHHHHHALVMALKLKRAGTTKSSLSPDEIRAELKAFWEPGGLEHFREEEEILLPAYAQYASLELPEITEMLLEHVKIRSLVNRVLKENEKNVLVMNELGHLLEAHVRKEERVIFPMIEDALPEKEIQKLQPYFHSNDK